MPTNYSNPAYWDKRYRKAGPDDALDWLESFHTLKDFLLEVMPSTEMSILVLGCGNAQFSEDLYDAGYKNQLNVDISAVCIQ